MVLLKKHGFSLKLHSFFQTAIFANLVFFCTPVLYTSLLTLQKTTRCLIGQTFEYYASPSLLNLANPLAKLDRRLVSYYGFRVTSLHFSTTWSIQTSSYACPFETAIFGGEVRRPQWSWGNPNSIFSWMHRFLKFIIFLKLDKTRKMYQEEVSGINTNWPSARCACRSKFVQSCCGPARLKGV